MSVSRRLALIMVVLLTFAEGLLLTIVSSSIIKTDGDEQVHPAVLEMNGGITKAHISKRSVMHYDSSCKSCGLFNPHRRENFLIIKGDTVSPPYKYPWMVRLHANKGNGYYNLCGGSIINEYYILTAAHCIKKTHGNNPINVYFHPKDVTVNFLTASYDTKQGPEVEKIIPHPEYTPWKNDIALLKLKNKIICDKFKNPICLPPPNMKISEGMVLQTAGWGRTEEGHPKELQEGAITYVDFALCNEHPIMKETHYCFKAIEKNPQNPCFGDSGGPVFYQHDKRFYIIGTLSRSDCKVGSLYTPIPLYINWIREITTFTP